MMMCPPSLSGASSGQNGGGRSLRDARAKSPERAVSGTSIADRPPSSGRCEGELAALGRLGLDEPPLEPLLGAGAMDCDATHGPGASPRALPDATSRGQGAARRDAALPALLRPHADATARGRAARR